jgi:hypothetical protein
VHGQVLDAGQQLVDLGEPVQVAQRDGQRDVGAHPPVGRYCPVRSSGSCSGELVAA